VDLRKQNPDSKKDAGAFMVLSEHWVYRVNRMAVTAMETAIL